MDIIIVRKGENGLDFFAVGYQADLFASFFLLCGSFSIKWCTQPSYAKLSGTNRIPLPVVLTGYHSQWY